MLEKAVCRVRLGTGNRIEHQLLLNVCAASYVMTLRRLNA